GPSLEAASAGMSKQLRRRRPELGVAGRPGQEQQRLVRLTHVRREARHWRTGLRVNKRTTSRTMSTASAGSRGPHGPRDDSSMYLNSRYRIPALSAKPHAASAIHNGRRAVWACNQRVAIEQTRNVNAAAGAPQVTLARSQETLPYASATRTRGKTQAVTRPPRGRLHRNRQTPTPAIAPTTTPTSAAVKSRLRKPYPTGAIGVPASDHALVGQRLDLLRRHPQELTVHVLVVLAVARRAAVDAAADIGRALAHLDRHLGQ